MVAPQTRLDAGSGHGCDERICAGNGCDLGPSPTLCAPGAHVRIDVLLPYMGQKTRATADWLAMAAVLFLGWVTMWKMWENVINNYERGVVTNDYPLTPLFIPKIVYRWDSHCCALPPCR